MSIWRIGRLVRLLPKWLYRTQQFFSSMHGIWGMGVGNTNVHDLFFYCLSKHQVLGSLSLTSLYDLLCKIYLQRHFIGSLCHLLVIGYKTELDKYKVFMSAPCVHFTLTLLITQIRTPGSCVTHKACTTHEVQRAHEVQRVDGAHRACGVHRDTALTRLIGLNGVMGLIELVGLKGIQSSCGSQGS